MTQPSARNARFPAEYGDPGDAGLVPWSEVEDKLRAAANYWLATVNPDGRAHVRPVDGVWVDGALCFGGSPETRWVRNLQANPAVTVNLSSEAEAIILEGTAELITVPDHPLSRPSAEASVKKYPQYYTGGETPPFQPFWAFRPKRAFAWTLEGFPRSATRWTFGS